MHDLECTPSIRVQFIVFQGEVTALFPDEDEGQNLITCYAHIGQHSTAHKSLLRCKRATPAQYKDLYWELTQIYAPTALVIQ